MTHRFDIRWMLILVLAAFTATTGLCAETRPNIVLIVADDLGYRDLGCFGSPEAKTPNIDRLAKEGMRLTSFYVAWPACTPSRAALLTGRYPQRNGTYDMIRNDMVDYGHPYTLEEYAVSPERLLGTDEREVFISEALTGAGYVNACFGKWDGGQLRRYLPLQQGFHDFYGFTNTGIDYYTHERYGIPSMRRGNELVTEDRGKYATQLFEREALRFINEHARQPFFLYLPFNAPHGASNLDPAVRGAAQAPADYLALYPETNVKNANRRRIHLAATTCMDDAIGKVLSKLDEMKIADNTIVLFMSDNGGPGGADNGALRGGKSQMFEGGLRVPCVVRWPKQLPAGKSLDEFLTSLEVFPTLLRATGTTASADIALDGFDLLPVLKGERSTPRRAMFWQRRSECAARIDNWKWIQRNGTSLLFDLSADLSEKNDLASQRPEMVQMCQAKFAAWQRDMDAAPPRGPFRDF
jgi:arylsulfatase A-like enzyme